VVRAGNNFWPSEINQLDARVAGDSMIFLLPLFAVLLEMLFGILLFAALG
jgi:hypothetical protein